MYGESIHKFYLLPKIKLQKIKMLFKITQLYGFSFAYLRGCLNCTQAFGCGMLAPSLNTNLIKAVCLTNEKIKSDEHNALPVSVGSGMGEVEVA